MEPETIATVRARYTRIESRGCETFGCGIPIIRGQAGDPDVIALLDAYEALLDAHPADAWRSAGQDDGVGGGGVDG